MLKASHTFNLLDARRAISVTERQRYILRVRTLASAVVAQCYYASREALGFPLRPQPSARMSELCTREQRSHRQRGRQRRGRHAARLPVRARH